MKNRWKEVLPLSLLLGMGAMSALSYAQSSGAGNGGDPLELRIENVKSELRNWILTNEFKGLNLDGQDPKTLANFVLKSVDQASVSLTDRAVFVGGKERACVNFPQTQTIECNRAKLKAESDENLYSLMLHEYMGLAGLEQNRGEESDYKYSKQARDFVEYKLVAKLGAIRRSSGLASMKFVALPGGAFVMGAEGSVGRSPYNPHIVALSPFEIQVTEVTQGQYFAVMGVNPSRFKTASICPTEHQVINEVELCPNHPVESMTWTQAQEFTTKLTEMVHDGYRYRLPTEAEWEYSARAGSTGSYSFGKAQPLDYVWFDVNSGGRTHAVGGKRPNAFGLCDMHGNVMELVQDFYSYDFYKNGQVNPVSLSGEGAQGKVERGGSWYDSIGMSASFVRSSLGPEKFSSTSGFRLVRTPGSACCSGR